MSLLVVPHLLEALDVVSPLPQDLPHPRAVAGRAWLEHGHCYELLLPYCDLGGIFVWWFFFFKSLVLCAYKGPTVVNELKAVVALSFLPLPWDLRFCACLQRGGTETEARGSLLLLPRLLCMSGGSQRLW